mmetsp:Transcript_49399/g.55972  ORF Transcript_49399/g.55972 Transcript_49399/m.55972 type:complete len:105 (-) Transcript_49399:21-335(-)
MSRILTGGGVGLVNGGDNNDDDMVENKSNPIQFNDIALTFECTAHYIIGTLSYNYRIGLYDIDWSGLLLPRLDRHFPCHHACTLHTAIMYVSHVCSLSTSLMGM